jgi:hypothetical protein
MLLAVLAVAAVALPASMASAMPRALAVDECTLLTKKQAATIMQAKPFEDGRPDNGGCSWETDPYDRVNYSYVTVKVESLKKFLGGTYPDVRTAIDESTNVGIEPLDDVGSEAFLTFSPLLGEGYVDGVTVRVGKQVLDLGFQPTEKVANPSDELDDVISIVKKMAAKVRSS